ncbi:hypothetical protein BU24DRAFT_439585 [Aaosphaeria arxii CBS 175.79]|uniref:Zn(2)-C6 fungal-type domain-containing protein n=1 Tax=Aaosphaeria arxii CBS 175.79 TaxID=1450172 RepID=A0A6A5Y2J7_9PLEO|nr:uncharacterized protein BU24DRAFT_439585 [Aaosphaeria arxii CBS 175.79]KAF2019456.1 hypothetical protein BU24DRAFT_439585 [Aaosphaeria arxii CBS 175.79]
MSATLHRVVGASIVKPKTTAVACRKCHSRKVKCSGGQPCSNCERDGSDVECSYPNRVRHVRVKKKLLAEIARLKRDHSAITEADSTEVHEQISNGTRDDSVPAESAQASSKSSITSVRTHNVEKSRSTTAFQTTRERSNRGQSAVEEAARNPLLEDRPWFISLTPEMPVLVGEATDAAFATRFRQALSGKAQDHFPRTQYTSDPVSTSLTLVNFPKPTPARARVLMKVTLDTVCRRFHLVQKSAILAMLDQSIQNPAQCDAISTCKLFAMFALGEAYSARASFPGAKFPGIDYYNNATNILRVLSEKPRIECVEVMAMLSLYSIAMNRRHAAYCMAGCAMRFAILMGLHHNVPHTRLPNREHVEHRVRLWWTVYILDRLWATMLGQPVSIRDEDIDVALPSSQGLPDAFADDFHDDDDAIAGLRIARLSAEVTSSVYGRNMQQDSFSYRVQQALKKLDDWIKALPDSLRNKVDQASANIDMADMMLQLYYNQCLILVTRPVLLHVLRLRQAQSNGDPHNDPIQPNEHTLALADACVICAKKSYRLLVDAWINGSFPTFDYTLTQYLFSTSVILAISSFSQAHWPSTESEDFEAAVHILDQLSQNGSQAASEFMRHVGATRLLMEAHKLSPGQVEHDQTSIRSLAASHAMNPTEPTGSRIETDMDPIGFNLSEPSLQDLLSFPHLDLDRLETPFSSDDFQSFYWPDAGPSPMASTNITATPLATEENEYWIMYLLAIASLLLIGITSAQ